MPEHQKFGFEGYFSDHTTIGKQNRQKSRQDCQDSCSMWSLQSVTAPSFASTTSLLWLRFAKFVAAQGHYSNSLINWRVIFHLNALVEDQ